MRGKEGYVTEYELLKAAYDIVRLRHKVSMLSFVSESLSLVRIPRITREE